MIYILGLPLHLWLGFLTITSLILTAITGIWMRKFGIKTHKALALLTVISAVAHAVIASMIWF